MDSSTSIALVAIETFGVETFVAALFNTAFIAISYAPDLPGVNI
jgi:hypothetical protein